MLTATARRRLPRLIDQGVTSDRIIHPRLSRENVFCAAPAEIRPLLSNMPAVTRVGGHSF